jgi:hypothetical protein
MSNLPFATPEDIAQLRAEREADRAFMREFLASIDDQVDAKKALKITGIKSLTTLIAERQRPGTPLAYVKNGRSVTYSRAGCVAYKLGYQLAA